MGSVLYVGRTAADDDAVVTANAVKDVFGADGDRSYVRGKIDDVARNFYAGADQPTGYATEHYVDTQDSLYVEPRYYLEQDKLNIPRSHRGRPGGVAALDGSGTIPEGQVPILGADVIAGPYGLERIDTSGGANEQNSTFDVPMQIGVFHVGVTAWNFWPLVFLSVLIDVEDNARPVVEVRIGDAEVTDYAAQTLVASGTGRAMFNDTQVVAVTPGPDHGVGTSLSQNHFSPNLDARLSVWAYSIGEPNGRIRTNTGAIVAAAAYLARVQV